jgi:hypothetical protein
MSVRVLSKESGEPLSENPPAGDQRRLHSAEAIKKSNPYNNLSLRKKQSSGFI